MSGVRSVGAWVGAALGLSLVVVGGARAGDLLVTAAKPDRLFVIDAAKRSVRSEHRIAGAEGQIFTTLISPDQRTAYLLPHGRELARLAERQAESGMDEVRGRQADTGERSANDADPPCAGRRDPLPERGEPGRLGVDSQDGPAAVQQR